MSNQIKTRTQRNIFLTIAICIISFILSSCCGHLDCQHGGLTKDALFGNCECECTGLWSGKNCEECNVPCFPPEIKDYEKCECVLDTFGYMTLFISDGTNYVELDEKSSSLTLNNLTYTFLGEYLDPFSGESFILTFSIPLAEMNFGFINLLPGIEALTNSTTGETFHGLYGELDISLYDAAFRKVTGEYSFDVGSNSTEVTLAVHGTFKLFY